jgi:hypothetical protein
MGAVGVLKNENFSFLSTDSSGWCPFFSPKLIPKWQPPAPKTPPDLAGHGLSMGAPPKFDSPPEISPVVTPATRPKRSKIRSSLAPLAPTAQPPPSRPATPVRPIASEFASIPDFKPYFSRSYSKRGISLTCRRFFRPFSNLKKRKGGYLI